MVLRHQSRLTSESDCFSMKPGDVEKYMALLGCNRLRWAGTKLHAACPFARWNHKGGSDSSPSFAVYRTPRGGLRYNCLACGEKGKLIGLLWKMRARTGEVYWEAMELIYDPYLQRRDEIPTSRLDYRIGGSQVGKATVRPRNVPRETDFEPGSVDMPQGETEMLWEDMEANGNVSRYHKPEEWEIKRYTDVKPPPEVLERCSPDAYQAWGLGYDQQKRRWMFPCRDRDGELVGYTGRLMWDGDFCFRCGKSIVDEGRTVKRRETDPDAKPVYVRKCSFCYTSYTKYWHLPGEWKRRSLYGIHLYEPGRPLVVVEGSTDVIRLWDIGVRCPVGIFGNQVNPEQADLIKGLEPPIVLVVGDGDQGGQVLNAELSKLLENRNVPHRVVELPDGVDPGKLSAQVAGQLLGAAMSG